MLDDQIKFYQKNRHRFLKLYENKYIVIKASKVIGVYDSHQEAYDESVKAHAVGTFLIKHIIARQKPI